MKSPTEVLTALASALDRLSKWIGHSQAEAAKAQQPEIDAMDAEIQRGTGRPPKGTHDTEPQATAPAALPVAADGRG